VSLGLSLVVGGDADADNDRLYYLNPFNYLIGSLLVFTTWDITVTCKTSELAIFNPPSTQTCAEYLTPYLQGMGARTNLLNPDAMSIGLGLIIWQH
jgi:hypothetical protein